MGSENNDKWMGRLKDSVISHSEPLPDSFWEEIQKDIPAPAPAAGRWGRYVWTVSAAAVVLVALILLLPADAVEDTPVFLAQENQQYAQENQQYAQENQLSAQENQLPVSENAQLVKGQLYPSHKELQPVKEDDAHWTGNDNVKELDIVRDDGTEEKKEKVPVKEKPQEEDVTPEQKKKVERDELLRELEYLRDNGKDEKRGAGRRWLSFAGGNNGISINNFASGYDTGPSFSTNPGSVENMSVISGFVNMDCQPVEDVVWLGENSPQIFNNPVSYKCCSYDHSAPVKMGLSIAWEIWDGKFLETGITYQYLKSEMSTGLGTVQKLHYIGIPVRLSGTLVKSGSFSIYLSGGYLMEKCIYGVLEHNNAPVQRLHVKNLQHSLNASIGLQLGVGGGASLYIEPGAYRYLGMEDGCISMEYGYEIRNKYSEDPGGFSFQGGIRFVF